MVTISGIDLSRNEAKIYSNANIRRLLILRLFQYLLEFKSDLFATKYIWGIVNVQLLKFIAFILNLNWILNIFVWIGTYFNETYVDYIEFLFELLFIIMYNKNGIRHLTTVLTFTFSKFLCSESLNRNTKPILLINYYKWAFFAEK